MRGIIAFVAWGLLGPVLVAAADGVAVLPPDAVLVDEVALATHARSRDVAPRGAPLAKAQLARELSFDAGEDPLSFEVEAASAIESLRAAPPEASLEPALSALVDYAPRVYRRHPETAGEWYVPVFDLAGSAAGTLAMWREQRAGDAWLQRAKSGALDDAAWAHDATGLVNAVERADAATLAVIRAKALATDHALPARFWPTLAMRSKALAVWQRVLAEAPPDARAQLVAAAPTVLDSADASALLETALRDPALQSLALSTLARTRPKDRAVDSRLFDALREPSLGATAASALARRPSARRIEALGALVMQSTDRVEQKHVLLTLRLIGSDAALDAARRYGSRLDADAVLRDEVASW